MAETYNWNPHQKGKVTQVLTDSKWLIAHQLIEGYSEKRPYDRPKYPPKSPFVNDCSGTLKLIWEWAGLPSPDNGPWGYGNTETLVNAEHSYHVPLSPNKWQPLDFVFYSKHSGPFHGGPGEHVVMLTDKVGSQWFAISHGGDSGPTRENAMYRPPVAVRRYRIPLK